MKKFWIVTMLAMLPIVAPAGAGEPRAPGDEVGDLDNGTSCVNGFFGPLLERTEVSGWSPGGLCEGESGDCYYNGGDLLDVEVWTDCRNGESPGTVCGRQRMGGGEFGDPRCWDLLCAEMDVADGSTVLGCVEHRPVPCR